MSAEPNGRDARLMSYSFPSLRIHDSNDCA